MKRLTYLAAAACFLALTSCREPQRTEDMAADATNWKPGIYSAARQDDGVVLSVVLLAEKKMQFYAGERLLAAFWTCADAPTDVFIAVRDGGLILGSGITTSADRLGLGEVVFPDGFSDLKAGVNDIVLGTVDGKAPFGVRLIPSTENEIRAIRNHEPVGRANSVITGAPPDQESVESPPTTLSPKARSFVESVEKDSTGFFFSVSFWEQTGMSQGIRFAMKAAHEHDKKSIVIDKKEAMAMTRYFVNNGMLDKTDVHPPGVTSPGWNVFLGTDKAEAYWHLGKERDALLKSAKVMGVRSVLTGKSLEAWDDFMRSVRDGKSRQITEPKADHSGKAENATGIEVDWGGVKMTSPEPRILPASMKDKVRERMSPREIVTTFGKGWMAKHSSVGSISWRFEDGSMIHINYRPGTTLVDEAVDVYRYEPPKNEGATLKTDDEINKP